MRVAYYAGDLPTTRSLHGAQISRIGRKVFENIQKILKQGFDFSESQNFSSKKTEGSRFYEEVYHNPSISKSQNDLGNSQKTESLTFARATTFSVKGYGRSRLKNLSSNEFKIFNLGGQFSRKSKNLEM